MDNRFIGFMLGGLTALSVAMPQSALGQANLESPPNGGFVSGVGLIRGWRCDAPSSGVIDLVIDGSLELKAPYGSIRADTEGTCGDTDNGWGATFNFNLVGAGEHTITASADGEQFKSTTFRVGRPTDEDFLRGAPSTYYIVPDFPEDGTATAIRWEQVQQNFMIVEDGNNEVVPEGGTWMNSEGDEFEVCWNVSDDGTKLTSQGSACEEGVSLLLKATGRTNAGLNCAVALATTADIEIQSGLFVYTIVDPVGVDTVSTIVGRFIDETSARGAADSTSDTVNSCTVDYTNMLQ